MDVPNISSPKKVLLADTLAQYSLLATVFLLPLFFIPSPSVPFQFTKIILFALGTILSVVFWIIGRLKDGECIIPINWFSFSAIAVPVTVFMSALLSDSVRTSLVGQGTETGTFSFVLLLFVSMLIVPIVLRTREKVGVFHVALIASALVLALFQIVRLIWPGALEFSIFTESASTLLNNAASRWKELGIFFGTILLVSITALEFLPHRLFVRITLYASVALSLFFLLAVNFREIWVTLSVLSLIMFVYALFYERSAIAETQGGNGVDKDRIPLHILFLLVISVLGVLWGGSLGSRLVTAFRIESAEVRPTWAATLEVSEKVLVRDPLLGAGPNRFSNSWLMHKPDGVNASLFWNRIFTSGFGYLPSFIVMSGLLGVAAWLSFLVMFGYTGFRGLFSPVSNPYSRYLIVSSFFASIFLWVFAIIYVPSPVILALTFLMSGALIAILYQEKILRRVTISFFSDPKVGFVAVVCLVFVIVGAVSFGYIFTEKYVASIYFQKGILAFNQKGDLGAAEKYLKEAADLAKIDVYPSFLAELNLIRLGELLGKTNDLSKEPAQTEFRTYIGEAVARAQQAVSIDPTNYQNWLELGRVYEAVLPLGIEGAYENAKKAYDRSLELNPRGPDVYVTLSRLEFANKNTKEARSFAEKAIAEKPNYTEAIFLKSQIDIQDGNIDDAIKGVEAASFLAPNDPGIFFQLGFLRYNKKNWSGAAEALEQATRLNNAYANAKYFLGLSYYELKRTADAVKEFEEIQTLNPDNKEIASILANLKAGKAPFSGTAGADKPEKRSKPPVKEEKSGV